MSDNFKKETLNGISWSVISQGIRLVLNLLITSVLARLLLPEDYGILGMVTVATGFLMVLKDFGFGAALVQKKEVEAIEYDSVFWLNVIIGLFLAIIVFLAAPLIANFYNESAIIPVARLISVSFIINSILVIPNNILLKRLNFKYLFFSDLSALLVSGITAILFAYYNFSYWSLVAQNLALQISTLIAVFYFSQWRPRFRFSKTALQDLTSFSLPLIADKSINYWVRNVDYLLIGKFLGKADLGYYTKAYTLMMLPVRQLSGTISKVMFPSFSTIQNDLARVRSVFLKISGVIALVSFPLMGLLFISAEEVILILFGSNWEQSIPIFRVLCLLGAIQSISTLSGNIYLSQGKTKLMFKIGLFTRFLMISGIVIGLYYKGLMGLVYGYTVSSLIASMIEWYFVGNVLEAGLKYIILNLLPYFIFSGLMIGLIFLFNINFNLENKFSSMFLNIILGGGFYIILLLIFKPKAYLEVLALIKQRSL
ncbi:MOP flippase family protein [Christiangramia salexigens]|uniref:Uncharacterized protein n=1 Tax=Christiangramia salexigens TaxID=1913577 RepID=A0A1L3J2C8_9FLAO|nr:MOP flippase family protein [Christiangramia salexigens]APG59268.1 hypothetical protein LPB144_02070 [Christiangramia salexigens]